MPISPYVAAMRARIGSDLLMLPSVAGVVRNDAGQVLFARRSDTGQWSVPGGVVDPGEQPAEAVVREVFEETGVHIAVDAVAGVACHPVRYPNGDRCDYLSVWFRCRALGGVAAVNDDESLEVGWFAPDALPPQLNDWVRLRVETALRDAPDAWFAPVGERHPALQQPDAL